MLTDDTSFEVPEKLLGAHNLTNVGSRGCRFFSRPPQVPPCCTLHPSSFWTSGPLGQRLRRHLGTSHSNSQTCCARMVVSFEVYCGQGSSDVLYAFCKSLHAVDSRGLHLCIEAGWKNAVCATRSPDENRVFAVTSSGACCH